MLKEEGLYRQELEHDSCGIGFVANLKNKKSHKIISDALFMLENMEHRGGTGSDPDTGDGAGVLIQTPHLFFEKELKNTEIKLPKAGKYGVAVIFFPKDESIRNQIKTRIEEYAQRSGFEVLGYRLVPVDASHIGVTAKEEEPQIEQLFLKPLQDYTPVELDRKLVVLRKYTIRTIRNEIKNLDSKFYIVSCSSRVIIYKGMLRTDQLKKYFLDLQNKDLRSALALIHSRFSTNTSPEWRLAQPFRYIAHNGEINTIKGNVNWMKSKQVMLESENFTFEEIDKMMPICDIKRSDSSNLDNLVELLYLSGKPLAQSMMMLIPEAWQHNPEMRAEKRAFYEYYSSIMEPWDGPASISFTDGEVIGATLDRNGLRPSRFCILDDDTIVMSSEAGSLPVDESKVIEKGRLKPGRIFIADLKKGRIISDEEVKREICSQQPYGRWLKENKLSLRDLARPKEKTNQPYKDEELLINQLAFGYSKEDVNVILKPMVKDAKEPIGSMGADTPLAVLSKKSQHLSNYFKQLFAQVSNPPIDPIREKIIMSLNSYLGSQKNILSETPQHCRQIHLETPLLSNGELDKIRMLDDEAFKSYTVKSVFSSKDRKGTLERSIDEICNNAIRATLMGCNILIISNRTISKLEAPIPSLLAVGAIHNALIKRGIRTQTSLVVEAGDALEVHHFATLIGFGANAINPFLAGDTIRDVFREEIEKGEISIKEVLTNYRKAIDAGLLKVMSKMGISTLQSYHGAQIFEALGISEEVIEKCFAGTVSRIGGMTFNDIAKETLIKHHQAYDEKKDFKSLYESGIYQWKRKGEAHLFNPSTIHLLQKSTRLNDFELYKKYAEEINTQKANNITLRSLFKVKKQKAIPVSEVEPVENILKRFASGAMSFGSISHEAHTTLAIAMNRIGAKSNSGEGGEDEVRFLRKENGDWERSAIKQVASGRFGVTSNYLTNADEIQIKMAQGAKPGEGGQLPGFKVDAWIGRVRHSTPGVGLISPPPHHDIYSIEDLAQLIFDLKNANRKARINVKLVSSTGVGTIASGVAKAKGDVILIAGYDGGTGATPLSSVRHAGLPWEIGLAEAHQTLLKNDLRSRVTLQTDGQIRTGKDLVIATLLGAEEWGVATAALVVEGCIMMRKCHLNTCPVGIATQNPELRKLFTGKPEHLVNFFTFLAEDLREQMAALGFRTINEMVGRTDLIEIEKREDNWKLNNLDLSNIIHVPEVPKTYGKFKSKDQNHEIETTLDLQIYKKLKENINKIIPATVSHKIVNTNRSVGAILSNEISKIHGSAGLPDNTLHLKFEGSAGQSFGAFTTKGITMELEGEANDYFGKGLSGAKLLVYPSRKAKFEGQECMIVGNVAFYGATSGKAFINGKSGERFCVRNSGVTAVVEGVGDHACEYMTGGRVVVLGTTGRNFGAGMSGGDAFVWDYDHKLKGNFNDELADLEALSEKDENELKVLIQEHYDHTKSPQAKRVLEDWDNQMELFVKVMPRDYKRVLRERAKAEKNTKNLAATA